jgi:hypothetical protein
MKNSLYIILPLIAVTVVFWGCQNSGKPEETTSLFNGKNLDGWRFYKNKENNSWEVTTDGLLHCKRFDGNEKRADLVTDTEFENFELTWDWKISHQGNSGVMFGVVEIYDEPYLSGPEYQLLDDVGYPGRIEDWQKTASNYAMHVAAEAKPTLAGEWNSSKILVNQSHVEHWLNGTKVVEYELGSEDWKARKEKSKWSGAIGYGASKKGRICLQDHGGEVWFKNISILVLP